MSAYPMILMSLLAASVPNILKAQDFRIIYVGDPMCSWCYGFSNEITTLRNTFPDVPFEVIAGGLRIQGRETMSELKDFLREHWEEVALETGAQFKFDILDKDMYYDTEPACRALAVFKSLQPENTLQFFKEMQSAFYYENHDPLNIENYARISAKFGLDPEVFLKLMLSDEGKDLLQRDLQKARDINARSFPSVYLEFQGKMHLITRGFSDVKSMSQSIQSILVD